MSRQQYSTKELTTFKILIPSLSPVCFTMQHYQVCLRVENAKDDQRDSS
jgi:hypothetical protein